MILAGHMSTIVMLFLTGHFKYACQRAVPLCCCPHWAVGIALPIIFGGIIGFGLGVAIPYGFWLFKVYEKRDEIIAQCQQMDQSTRSNNNSTPPIAQGTLVTHPQPVHSNVFQSQQLPIANAVAIPVGPNTPMNGNIPVAQYAHTSAVGVETVG